MRRPQILFNIFFEGGGGVSLMVLHTVYGPAF